MRRLVEALNACWRPHFPGQPEITLADFKRDIRERQVWCSSCMIAFDGAEPIGVLIGAKRPHATLVDRIAVRPDRVRQGHGRHMLESLGAKLEILGPPLIVTEIPESLPGAAAFFEACGYERADRLVDWALEDGSALAAGAPAPAGDRFLVPQTVADLAANRLLADRAGIAWDQAAATLLGRAERIEGFGVTTVDQIEAFVLFHRHGEGRPGATIDALTSAAGQGEGPLLGLLLAVIGATGAPLVMPRLGENDATAATLARCGFRPAAAAWRYTAGRPGLTSP
ncbi:MAG TPA: GNAT family N-acetyltransferase [Dongiaceae bacterium]|nr:GNAT family N-acetyltransferase [Dongiaceae bacterium]